MTYNTNITYITYTKNTSSNTNITYNTCIIYNTYFTTDITYDTIVTYTTITNTTNTTDALPAQLIIRILLEVFVQGRWDLRLSESYWSTSKSGSSSPSGMFFFICSASRQSIITSVEFKFVAIQVLTSVMTWAAKLKFVAESRTGVYFAQYVASTCSTLFFCKTSKVKLVTNAVIRATEGFNSQCNNVARHVEGKCCLYYRTFPVFFFYHLLVCQIYTFII